MRKRLLPEERKAQILQAALHLFRTRGYDNTSLQAIIAEAGVSKGGFYHYYETKADLIDDLAEQLVQQITATVKDIVRREDLTALDKLNQHIQAANSHKKQEATVVTSLLAEIYAEHKNVLLEDRIYSSALRALQPLIEAIIRQGIAEGDFRTRYPDEAAEYYVNLFMLNQSETAAAFAQALRERDPQSLAQLKRRYAFLQELTEKMLGLAPDSLILKEVAEDTIDSLWHASETTRGSHQEG